MVQIFHVNFHELYIDRLVLNDWCITSLALQMVCSTIFLQADMCYEECLYLPQHQVMIALFFQSEFLQIKSKHYLFLLCSKVYFLNEYA